MDEDYELEIEYSAPHSAESKYKTVTITLDDYRHSFADEVFHLQQSYDRESINEHIYPLKRDFILECADLKPGEKILSDMSDLVDEMDNALNDYLDECSEDPYDDDDDGSFSEDDGYYIDDDF